jgi:hypothetical protein
MSESLSWRHEIRRHGPPVVTYTVVKRVSTPARRVGPYLPNAPHYLPCFVTLRVRLPKGIMQPKSAPKSTARVYPEWSRL